MCWTTKILFKGIFSQPNLSGLETTNSMSSRVQIWLKTLPVHVFGQAAAVKLLKNTSTHTDQRRMETEAQTSEGGRTQVSNCSNTDVMK